MATSATALWRSGQPRLYDDSSPANRRSPASSGLALAHQGFDPASLDSWVFGDDDPDNTQAPAAGGGRLTLERRLERVWEGLLAVGAAECPVCRSTMERRGAAANCVGCGSTLS